MKLYSDHQVNINIEIIFIPLFLFQIFLKPITTFSILLKVVKTRGKVCRHKGTDMCYHPKPRFSGFINSSSMSPFWAWTYTQHPHICFKFNFNLLNKCYFFSWVVVSNIIKLSFRPTSAFLEDYIRMVSIRNYKLFAFKS